MPLEAKEKGATFSPSRVGRDSTARAWASSTSKSSTRGAGVLSPGAVDDGVDCSMPALARAGSINARYLPCRSATCAVAGSGAPRMCAQSPSAKTRPAAKGTQVRAPRGDNPLPVAAYMGRRARARGRPREGGAAWSAASRAVR